MISLSDMPDWPRLMSEEQAAAYVGVSVNTFVANIGNPFPEPLRFGRRKLYDRTALDRAVDALSASTSQSPGEKIRRERRHDPTWRQALPESSA